MATSTFMPGDNLHTLAISAFIFDNSHWKFAWRLTFVRRSPPSNSKIRSRHEICASRLTKRCACHETCAPRFTKRCACCTSRLTKCCTCHETCKRATCPRVTIHCACQSRNQSASKIQSAAPATNLHFEAKAAPIPCACQEKSTFLRAPRKVTAVCENARGATTRAQSFEAPAADTQILRACAVDMHVDNLGRRECVNSSELAGEARAA